MSNNITYKKSAYFKISDDKKLFLTEFIKLLIGFDLTQKAESFFSKFITSKSIDSLIKKNGFSYEQILDLINFSNLTIDDKLQLIRYQMLLINSNEDAFDMCLKDINTYVEIRFKQFLGE